MSLFQYAGLRLNFNCWLSGFNTLASSLIFSQAVQTLGSIAPITLLMGVILSYQEPKYFTLQVKFSHHKG
jgi:hypothetical protein